MAVDNARAEEQDDQDKQAAQDEKEQECFLCVLERHPCAVAQLEGRIIAAHETRVDGETVPWVTLDTGTSFVSITLTRYYKGLLKGLLGLPAALRTYNLHLRVYHLPPMVNITEHNGRRVQRYRANSYTLAVLEPDTLLNITDLNTAEYCARQYLLSRLAASGSSVAMIRGNLVHSSFKELLKEHARGRRVDGRDGKEKQGEQGEQGEDEPLAILHRHFEAALERSSIDLALLGASTGAMHEEVAPHLESLANWFARQHTTLWDLPAEDSGEGEGSEDGGRDENMVRAETFLLAPEIGLRGRLDLLWKQTGRQRLLELKSGGASGNLPRDAHRWQVHGYHALLAVRRDSKMKKALATLLYSGTPGEAQDFGIPFTVKQLQRVNETRNILVLSHVTGVPPAPPGPSRCTKCAMLTQCSQVSELLDWQPPQPDLPDDSLGEEIVVLDDEDSPARGNGNHPPANSSSTPGTISASNGQTAGARPLISQYSPADRAFFARYYRLLQQEGIEIEKQQALLWKTPVEEHVARGTAIAHLEPVEKPQQTEQGEWLQTFRCVNTSELREGDEVLLSDGSPITGEVVTGTVMSVSAEQVTVWTPELIAHPALIDRYGTSIVHVRTVQNLLRWLSADVHVRGLVAGSIRPRFMPVGHIPRIDFNREQNLAIERAMQMQDYLLVHGPPGTGKTSVIAEIVRRLVAQGQRVLLAAFTNQAVDNMLGRLEREGFSAYVRLGHERSVNEAVRGRLLQNLVEQEKQQRREAREQSGQNGQENDFVREILRKTPVLASTTATWSSDRYTPVSIERTGEDAFLQFDVALIDEAGQLTIPAILGALRFARRFILVGDEKQLPPLVLSAAAAQDGLADSLFSLLKRLDDEHIREHPEGVSACVPLRVQYRMNRWISYFSSRVFYEGQLKPHASVANRLLEFRRRERGAEERSKETVEIIQALDPGKPIVFLDVQEAQGGEAASGTKISNAEARAVRDLVAGLLARGIAEADIGIIAPYRAQVANLRRHLFSDDEATNWSALAFDTPLSVDTVDRFQGGERAVIIMSFATPVTPEAESQLREHLTNPNRLNVALTRAQRKLILVGNIAALEPLPIFSRLITYCRGLQTVISATPAPQ